MNKSMSLGILCVCAAIASTATGQSPGGPGTAYPGSPYPGSTVGNMPQIRQSFYNTPAQTPTANSNSFSPAGNASSNPGWVNGPDARLAANPNSTSGAPVGAPMGTPTDETAGNAEGKIPVRSLLQMFHDGGIMMYPIALCSFVLMVFSFERFISLRTGRVIPRPFVKRLIEQLQQQQIDRDEALELCERNPSSIATLLAAAVKRYGRPAVEIEQAVLDAGERESNSLRRHMRLLNAISNVAPLLGLLGTVMGMIQSFNDISGSQAMGRPEMLAGGISEALLTTAAGLLVAIPAYLMYMYFLGHTDRLISEMDMHSQRLVDAISAEGLQESDSSRGRTRSRKAA